MAIAESDRVRIVERLLRDVEATLGPGKDAIVQQYFHDCSIDTSWPRCPRHPQHPLWLHEESWCCERDDIVIAKLGELGRATIIS